MLTADTDRHSFATYWHTLASPGAQQCLRVSESGAWSQDHSLRCCALQALDISNASRVAQFIASQSSAQYLVVSHKPHLYEKALSLLGIYTLRGSSAACMLSLPANEQCARQN